MIAYLWIFMETRSLWQPQVPLHPPMMSVDGNCAASEKHGDWAPSSFAHPLVVPSYISKAFSLLVMLANI